MSGLENIKVIVFDADDTLWVNEPYFREAEDEIYKLIGGFMSRFEFDKALLSTEIKNIPYYGYGVKPFIISVIENLIEITQGQVSTDVLQQVIAIGKKMLDKPVELLKGVEKTLKYFYGKYLLVLATKGDLLDQKRKLEKSGLNKYFHHIEVLTEKNKEDYEALFHHLDTPPSQCLMVGNSVKSDILPVIAIGGYAAHIPFHTTWELEKAPLDVSNPRVISLNNINELIELFSIDD